MKKLLFALAILIIPLPVLAAWASFTASSSAAPVITGSTIYGSSPAVANATMHQAGSASTASIANSGGAPTSCSITAGDPSGNFQCVINAGAVQIEYTTTGATNLNGSSELVTQTLTVTASNTGGTSTGVSVPVNVYNDGALQAPVGGQIPKPTFFSSYTHGRPPWLVPGVDYPVGVPSASLPLKVPGVNTLPTGVTLTSSTVLTMTGTNIVLDGWDMTNGSVGMQVQLVNCNGCAIENSLFNMGTFNHVPVFVSNSGNSSNLTLTNVEITNNDQEDVNTFGGLVYWQNGQSGGQVIEYSYLHDTGADFVDVVATVAGTSNTVRHNAFINNSAVTLTHPDFLQMCAAGGTCNVAFGSYTYTVNFNFWANNNPPSIVAGQGLVFGDNAQIAKGTNIFDYNVTISTGTTGAMSNWVTIAPSAIDAGATISVQNNYVDLTSANGFNSTHPTNPLPAQATWGGNFNLVTGATFTFTQ